MFTLKRTACWTAGVLALALFLRWLSSERSGDAEGKTSPRVGLSPSPASKDAGAAVGGSRAATSNAEPSSQRQEAPPVVDLRKALPTTDWKLREYQRAVEKRFGAALRALRLPPDKYQTARNYLVERMQCKEDIRTISREKSLMANDIAAVSKQTIESLDAESKAALGEREYDNIAQLLKEGEYHDSVNNEFGVDMAFAGFPISETQAAQLAHALYVAFSPDKNPKALADRLIMSERLPGLSITDEKAVNAAANILTPAQAAIFQEDLRLRTKTYVQVMGKDRVTGDTR